MFIVLALVLASPVEALINVDNAIHTGVFSISSGQTVRVYINHVLGRQARCVVTVSFLNANGDVVVGPTPLTAGGGRAAFTEYSAAVSGSGPLRAVVELTPTPGARNGNCIVTAEVVESASGLTQFMIGNAAKFAIVQF